MVLALSFLKQMIEERLDELIRPKVSNFDSLFEGARYTLLNSGKRIRPLLTLAASEMFQKNSAKKALDVACAIEMIHTYSLIHDDLPCMDNDDFRRGKPTLHRVYNEGHAVLVGDYLLTYAFEVIAECSLSSEKKVALIASLAKGAGSEGMIGGQVMDISLKENFVEETLFRKTAVLFGTSLECAAIVNGISKEIEKKIVDFGHDFGEIFQLVDDLIDEDHPLGKEHALCALKKREARAKASLADLPFDSSLIIELLDSLLDRIMLLRNSS